MAFGTIYLFFGFQSNVTASDLGYNALTTLNKTPTDIFTTAATMAAFGNLFWFVLVMNFKIGKELQPLLDLFEREEPRIFDCVKKRAVMSKIFKFFWL